MEKYGFFEQLHPEVTIIHKKMRYVAYVDKQIVFFDTRDEATQAGKLIDIECVNEEEHTESKRLSRKRDADVYDAWYSALKEECSLLVATDTFNEYFTMIQDIMDYDYHYDEIAERMYEFAVLGYKVRGRLIS